VKHTTETVYHSVDSVGLSGVIKIPSRRT